MRPVENRLTVRSQRRSRLHACNIVPTFKSGYQTVSVWVSFSMRGRISLVVANGSFDRNTHRAIIDNHVHNFIYDVHGGTDTFVLQEDNCCQSFYCYVSTERRGNTHEMVSSEL